ncbi:MAG: hypothetical protein R2746_03365 [Acidimicrobiales bacterium]|nr:hypothetical protein [Actinomycetota bacterium]MCB0878204.1 hypothetical protein [Thermoleophilia bacterium]
MRLIPTARRVALAALLAGSSLLTGCYDAPTAPKVAVGFGCEVRSNHWIVPNTTTSSTSTYTTYGPQAAPPGGEMTMLIRPEPFYLSPGGNGGTVQNLTNMVWRVYVPNGTDLISQAIVGWSNVGSGRPTSSVSGRRIFVTIPGPIGAGTTATLPSLFLRLRVTAPAGSWIRPHVAGTSYSDPGLSFDLAVTGTAVGDLSPHLSCYPSATTDLRRTLVSADTKAPVITIASPVDGARIPKGARVLADYACEDHDGIGVRVATCSGTVADGAPIATATLGTKTFTVTATDIETKRSSKTVTYTVVAP